MFKTWWQLVRQRVTSQSQDTMLQSSLSDRSQVGVGQSRCGAGVGGTSFSRKDTCAPMFTAALLTAARTWKQPKCPAMADWMKKARRRYTVEHHAAVRRDEILACATTWTGLEAIVLSGLSRAGGGENRMTSLTRGA